MKELRLLLLFGIILSASCTKQEIIYQNEHINVVVEDNEAPPYSAVTTIQIEGYVNRMFIDLLGREPSITERDNITQTLKNGELSSTVRENVLTQLMATPEYYQRFYTIQSDKLLDGVLTTEVTNFANLFTNLYNQEVANNGNTSLAQIYLTLATKLTDLQNAGADYANGLISVNEFFARMIDNFIYDEINMGSENFVIACFEGLFHRQPTETELEEGITMVDGFSAQLLFLDGNTKDDFVEIVTSTPEFYQGLMIDIYRQLLARDPNSQEMGEGTLELTNTGDYQAAQRSVMILDEYAGF